MKLTNDLDTEDDVDKDDIGTDDVVKDDNFKDVVGKFDDELVTGIIKVSNVVIIVYAIDVLVYTWHTSRSYNPS
ncbi:hypothetical protein F8M41_016176 [Gigaspora margarita]|uniref:Uncharacterized protein n=1 Tax=Gigaspora margarita TaxID=4874 RepID=A0A8H3ZZX1_GIGMA|nr:hypothetical protein F8M41_016176 [Gigaspora margarita]